ncbi:sensor histidine kinase [Desmospora profundinema]|uniref:histidine kinase n=1 Tax=Desmospora profundinema TaxID=1571184 RepID=A0ABU1IJ63_9BACL|nr:ATP-binding protein [Desmospora profundinema]MDR6224039.1 signal transduction histidine kinase [Desmospora profundinema]
MRSNRIVFKLGGTIMLLFIMVLLPLGFVFNQIVSGFYYGQVREDIDHLSARYAQSIAESPDPMTIHMVEMMARFSEVKLYIVDDRGTIKARSNVLGLPKNAVSDQELSALSRGESIKKIDQDPASGNRFLVSGHPIFRGQDFYGGVYVLSSIDRIDQSLQIVRNLLILSGMGVFFLALGLTWVLSRKLSDPLIQMKRATRQIAKGDLSARVKVPSEDEIGALAQAINDMALDLQQTRTTQKEFFANVSHELRTPITYLEGYAKVLKEGLYQSEEEKEQYLEIIRHESKRLTRLVQDLSDLSKMESGQLELHFEWIDLAEVVQNAVRKTKFKAEEKDLELHVQIPDDLPAVYADGFRMEQIFINLLDNAIRYTETGSIGVQLNVDRDQVTIHIKDTGIGIPEEELPYLFERFYRVDKSRSRQYGGSGLGLAIVKQLVDLHGGRIEVSSQMGKGTRVTIILSFRHHPGGEEKHT